MQRTIGCTIQVLQMQRYRQHRQLAWQLTCMRAHLHTASKSLQLDVTMTIPYYDAILQARRTFCQEQMIACLPTLAGAASGAGAWLEEGGSCLGAALATWGRVEADRKWCQLLAITSGACTLQGDGQALHKKWWKSNTMRHHYRKT